MSQFFTQNPSTGEVIQTYQRLSWEQTQGLIDAAEKDFHDWRKTSWDFRSQVLKDLAQSLREHRSEFANIMQNEMGKALAEGLAEVEKSARTCEFYAENAGPILKNRSVEKSPYAHAEVSFQPLGVIFCIMPWNFPLWQMIRFAAPSLMAGNVILLKHADLTAGTAELIEKIFFRLTSEFQLLRNAPIDHEVAARVIAHKKIHGVTFTGSTAGGRAVAMEAAKSLKKIVLELGGSDAYLILPDANLKMAAKICAQARLVNCGQSCVAGKRFIVDKTVSDDFIDLFVAEMKKASLPPVAHKRFQATLAEQVHKMRSLGGRVILGGETPEGAGSFFPATVIVFHEDSPELHAEEIFGPIALVFVADGISEALRMANSSPYGLGGGIFTGDERRGQELIEKELQAGFVVVNDYVKSDAHIPFGGIKDSGYGRELGEFGILEFVNIKTVAVARVDEV